LKNGLFKHLSIGDLVERITLIDPTKQIPEKMFDYIDISSINRESKKIENCIRAIGKEAPSRARQVVRFNDVLVSTVRPNLNAVAIVPEKYNGAIASTGYTVLRVRQGILDPQYLFYWVRTIQFISKMVLLSTGASYPAVTDRIVKDSQIPLPSLDIQKKIATVLEKADQLREKRRRANEKLDQLLQAVFLEMFGDPVRNPKGWEVKKFEDIVDNTLLGLVRGSKEQNLNFKYNYIKMDSITLDGNLLLSNITRVNTTPIEAQLYTLKKGDFLFNTRNSKELVGKTAVFVAEGQYLFNNNILRVRFKKNANSLFVNRLFQTALIQNELNKRKSGTTSVFAIYYKNLKTLPIVLPPIELQIKFAEIALKIEEHKSKSTYSEESLERLFNSLMQRAFKGELQFNTAAFVQLESEIETADQG